MKKLLFIFPIFVFLASSCNNQPVSPSASRGGQANVQPMQKQQTQQLQPIQNADIKKGAPSQPTSQNPQLPNQLAGTKLPSVSTATSSPKQLPNCPSPTATNCQKSGTSLNNSTLAPTTTQPTLAQKPFQ